MASREQMLEEALRELRSVCFDRRDALTEFERLGELYYQEFGRLRPGKDDPWRDSNDPENVAQYEAWSKARTEAAFDLADRALSTPAEPSPPHPAHFVAVNKAALQMVRNALSTDAENGKPVRGEMLEELDKATRALDEPRTVEPLTEDELETLMDEANDNLPHWFDGTPFDVFRLAS